VSLGALITGLGRALVSWGLGGSDDAAAVDTGTVAFITLPAARPLYSVTLPAAAPLYTITLPRIMGILNIGDTALLDQILIKDHLGALVDPATFTVNVTQPSGVVFSLVYGTAATSGVSDAVIRNSAGNYSVQIEITPARGVGLYRYDVVTTGARAAEDGTFKVFPLMQ
jgi:hypothetical protein